MIGICETSNDLNGWNNVCKLLKLTKIGFIDNLIQLEERDITCNKCRNIIRKRIFWYKY